LLDALGDFERSVEGLERTEAEKTLPGFSAISWTVAHLAQHLDSWVIGSMAGQPRDDYLARSEFAKGGTGAGVEWDAVWRELSKVLGKSRIFLETVSETDLEREALYQGSMQPVRGKYITGNYRLARLIVHIYYHIGEIATIRAARGHKVSDFPGLLPVSLEAKGKA
jgi:hypothetical protein